LTVLIVISFDFSNFKSLTWPILTVCLICAQIPVRHCLHWTRVWKPKQFQQQCVRWNDGMSLKSA
jgi:hypothetical protein